MRRDFGSNSIETNRKQEEGIGEVSEEKTHLLEVKIMISTMINKGYSTGKI